LRINTVESARVPSLVARADSRGGLRREVRGVIGGPITQKAIQRGDVRGRDAVRGTVDAEPRIEVCEEMIKVRIGSGNEVRHSGYNSFVMGNLRIASAFLDPRSSSRFDALANGNG
jgi:hypothetical protein